MKNWKHTLDLKDIYKSAGDYSFEQLGEMIAKKIEPLKIKMDNDVMLDKIQDMFNGGSCAMCDANDFNYAMSLLYDFGDCYGVWVKTS